MRHCCLLGGYKAVVKGQRAAGQSHVIFTLVLNTVFAAQFACTLLLSTVMLTCALTNPPGDGGFNPELAHSDAKP